MRCILRWQSSGLDITLASKNFLEQSSHSSTWLPLNFSTREKLFLCYWHFSFFLLFAVESNPNVPLLYEKVKIGKIVLVSICFKKNDLHSCTYLPVTYEHLSFLPTLLTQLTWAPHSSQSTTDFHFCFLVCLFLKTPWNPKIVTPWSSAHWQ